MHFNGKICNDLEIYGGRSPFLLAQIGNYLCENADIQGNIREFTRNQGMINYYNDLIKILKDENYYNSMIEIFVGPKYKITPLEVNTLVNFGYIHFYKDKDAEKPRSISKDFTHYLYELIMLDENQVIWPKLNEVEMRLREIIEKVLENKYGRTWENNIRKIYDSNIFNNIGNTNFINLDRADTYIESLKKKYPGKIYKLLKVLSIWELNNLIKHFWQDGMKSHFNGIEKDDLQEKLNHLQHVRKPLAHSNSDYLSSEEIRRADLYCDQIMNYSVL